MNSKLSLQPHACGDGCHYIYILKRRYINDNYKKEEENVSSSVYKCDVDLFQSPIF